MSLTEILKDCPKGTVFYSPAYGDVKFSYINHTSDSFPIACVDKLGYYRLFTNGGFCDDRLDCECMLFPSKGQRDWSKWHRPFVDGDIVYYDKFVSIFKKWGDSTLFYSHISIEVNSGEIKDRCFGKFIRNESRFATEEEKQRFFDAIKANGYKWNADTKTLEELKFDPKTLQPFDKVLVRDGDGSPWGISLFSHLKESGFLRFSCANLAPWLQCVPYNDDTKHLVGTCNKAPEKYINW